MGSSISRTRSVGSGIAEPIASRMTVSSSIGMPDSTLRSAKVVGLSAEKWSKTGFSRKSSEIWPPADLVRDPVEGQPAALEGGGEPDLANRPRGEAVVAVGTDDPQLDDAVDVIDADPGPLRGLLPRVLAHDASLRWVTRRLRVVAAEAIEG